MTKTETTYVAIRLDTVAFELAMKRLAHKINEVFIAPRELRRARAEGTGEVLDYPPVKEFNEAGRLVFLRDDGERR